MRIERLMRIHRPMHPAGEHGADTGGTNTSTPDNTGHADTHGTEVAHGDDQTAGDQAPPSGSDKPALSDHDAKLLRDALRHKSRARELESELSQVKATLKQFEGIDPVKVRELLEHKQQEERKAAEARGEYDRILKQMAERHREETAALNAQLETARKAGDTLHAQIAELTVGNAFVSSRFVADQLTLTPAKARVIYGPHFEFKNGRVVGHDKPAGSGERTVLVDSAGDPLSFDDALRKLVESDPDKDQLLRAKSRAGSGSSTTTRGAQQAIERAAQASAAKLSGAEKIAAGLKALAGAR